MHKKNKSKFTIDDYTSSAWKSSRNNKTAMLKLKKKSQDDRITHENELIQKKIK